MICKFFGIIYSGGERAETYSVLGSEYSYDGEIDLASVPLAKGYTAEISYGEAGLSVTVPEKPSMGYTFPEPVESESEEVMQ